MAPFLEYHGHIDRPGVWAFYVTMEILALYTNLSFLIAIIRLREKRTSTDILIGGLCSGILCGLSECFPQCLSNLIGRTFELGTGGCWAEAFVHIIALQIQFFSVSAIAYRTYVGVVKLESFTQERAIKILIGIWVVSCFGTGLFGAYSEYGLSASGTFCFYSWTSIALVAWAWPTATLSACLMGYWYYKTFEMVKKVRKGAKDIIIDGSRKDADIALKLASLVFFFIFGYFTFVFLSIYEAIVGRSQNKPALDISAAVFGLIYWVAVPCAYGYTNQRLGIRSAILFCPFGSTTHGPVPANSTFSKQRSTKKSGPASMAETKIEMSGGGLVPKDTPADDETQDEVLDLEASPRSVPSPTDRIAESSRQLLGRDPENRTTPDSTMIAETPSAESPRIFNPFVAQVPDSRQASIESRSSLGEKKSFLGNELSPRSISVIEGPTPHDPPSTSTSAANFGFFSEQRMQASELSSQT